MKKILFAALITISITSSAFTKEEKKATSNEKKIGSSVLKAFTADFNEATDVCWTSKPDFERVSFNLDGKQLSAFYTWSGEKIGTTQEINLENLPLNAKKHISKKYNNYAVREAILFENDRETAYYVLVENNSQSVILKVMSGCVSQFKKTKAVINSDSSDKSLQLALF